MIELERARSALNALDSGCSREKWIRIGMAAKSAGLNFDDFHDWSKPAGNYKCEKDCRTVWESLKETGSVTVATLFHMAKENGWSGSVEKNNYSNKKEFRQIHNKPSTIKYAHDTWEICQPALSSHGYILRKRGKPD
jgi:putative DNA primase/helicase